MTQPRKTIDLLRHGEPVGGNVFRGRTDHPLTDLGWSQMREAVKGLQWDVIIASPLSRCWDFAQSLSQELDCELLQADGLREFDFGVWESNGSTVMGYDEGDTFWSHSSGFDSAKFPLKGLFI